MAEEERIAGLVSNWDDVGFIFATREFKTNRVKLYQALSLCKKYDVYKALDIILCLIQFSVNDFFRLLRNDGLNLDLTGSMWYFTQINRFCLAVLFLLRQRVLPCYMSRETFVLLQ